MSSQQFFTAPDWIKDAIFYQIFPDRFCNGDPSNDPARTSPWGDLPTRENFFGGDMQGILQKLDYLQNLGVNALYLNPIFQAQTNHRYDTVDYFQVDPALGDTSLLKELVRQAHQRGMHLILDGVFNHCGEAFLPFQDVLQNGASSAYAGWFLARSYPLEKEPLNYLSCGGCTYLPKFNHANPAVQQHILRVGRYWLEETGVDGWRLDVPFKIPRSLWQEFRKVVKTINPQAYLVGEIWREAQPWIQGDTFDGVTNYRLRDLIFDFVLTNLLDGEDFGYELQTLVSAHGPAAFAMFNLLGSHDTLRLFTIFKGDVQKIRLALTLQMTLPGAPMIYYGDEIGLPGEGDPDCRRCFPWEETTWNQPLYAATRELIALRKAHPCFRNSLPRTLSFFNGLYAYHQSYAKDESIVIVNTREVVQGLRIPLDSPCTHWREINSGSSYSAENGSLFFTEVPAHSALILFPAA